MQNEEIALFYVNCLLVDKGVRPGYLPAFNMKDTGYREQCMDIANKCFNNSLHFFSFGRDNANFLITKDELSQEYKDILSNTGNPRYHPTLGNILGYDCVDTFNLQIISSQRIEFTFNIMFIHDSNITYQLFAYVCPGTIVDGNVTLTQENLDRAIEYLNNIKAVFREDAYARLIVQKIKLDLSYTFPIPRHINRIELEARGLPLPAPLLTSPSPSPPFSSARGGRKTMHTRRLRLHNRRHRSRLRTNKNKY